MPPKILFIAVINVFLLVGCDIEAAQKINKFSSQLFSTSSSTSKSVTTLKLAEVDAHNRGRAMYWLDNSRLIAVAIDPPERILEGERGRSFARGLFIWDTVTQSSSQYLYLKDVYPGLCYYKGQVYYDSEWSQAQNFVEKRFGKFESEKITKEEWNRAEPLSNDRFLNYLDCQFQSRLATLRPEHLGRENAVLFLRSGDGYVFISQANSPNGDGITKENQNNFIQLIRGNDAPITLPIRAKEMMSASVHFSEFLNEYVISPNIPANGDYWHVYWPLDMPNVAYFMSPEGKVRKEEFPTKPRIGSHIPYPTKKGYFFPGGAISSRSSDAGGWLYTEGKFVKLYDHITTASAVSPDGCKVAIAVSYDSAIPAHQLQILDLCAP